MPWMGLDQKEVSVVSTMFTRSTVDPEVGRIQVHALIALSQWAFSWKARRKAEFGRRLSGGGRVVHRKPTEEVVR